MKNEEYYIQKNVVTWVKLQYPNVLINADVGGTWTRNIRQAIKNKCLGHSNGFPDLFLAEPRGDLYGLFIEMKTEKGRLSDEQRGWLTKLSKKGYCVAVAYGFEEAKKVISDYLK